MLGWGIEATVVHPYHRPGSCVKKSDNPLTGAAPVCHTTSMNKAILTALAGLALGGVALATPVPHPVVAPHEQTVLVPGLESLGESRISTVRHCAAITHTDWQKLITDRDYENMESCLIEHT